jgi:nitrite reductase/ring-hydroxylating ferredoxin subunit
MQWYRADGIAYTGIPFIKKVKLANKSLCIVSTGQEVFALAARCPHAGEDLSRGWCKQGKLVCPVHRFSYDLHTGRGNPGQNDYVDTFEVKIKGEEIYIGVNSFWNKLKQVFK